MSGRQCKFKKEWKEDPQFRDWLGEASGDAQRAYCKFCRKSFDVGNMGLSALKSHERGQGHVKIATQMKKETKITHFLREITSEDRGQEICRQSSKDLQATTVDVESGSQESTAFQVSNTNEEATCSGPQSNSTLSKFFSSQAVLEAEICWVIKMVRSHYSFNSSSDVSVIFNQMFPDSDIAKRFSCGATKSAYLLSFGLCPYFKEKLIKDVRKAKCYVVSFDECLNKVTQMEQMDIIVRYWCDREEKVAVRYFDSEFMGHTQAEKLLEKIKKTLSPLDPNKLLQISMDGPMVNWKFLKMFQEDKSQSDPSASKLLHLGSCALHVVHGSFQSGEKETGWKVGDVLRALWQLFYDSPASRADFIEMTKTSAFPLKICAHRWVEDLAVAERAIEIWPAVQMCINSHRKLPKSKVPSSASYCTVKEATADPLFVAKLHFFAFVARQLKPFLEKFQTDAPMVPFLAKELQSTIRGLLSSYIKREELEKLKTPLQLLKLDPQDKANYVPLKQLDTGFGTKQALEKASENLQDHPLKIQQFKKECISFLSMTCKKMMERSPLMFPVVRHLSSLDPVAMVANGESSREMFQKLLQNLLNAGWYTAPQCDEILAQYKTFSIDINTHHKAEFQHFAYTSRLDKFLGNLISGRPEYTALWDLIKHLLTLSHGQGAVERGYSINKDMLVENLKERSLVALRMVQDAMAEHPLDEVLPRDLILHCKGARMRYVQYLEDEKKKKVETANERKRKDLQQEIANVNAKRQKIMHSIETMQKEADEMAVRAERKHDFTLLSKSNAYRKSVTEKSEELAALEQSLKNMQESLKQLH